MLTHIIPPAYAADGDGFPFFGKNKRHHTLHPISFRKAGALMQAAPLSAI